MPSPIEVSNTTEAMPTAMPSAVRKLRRRRAASELAVRFIRPTRIRAYGSLNFKDSPGHIGRLELTRSGDLSITINDQTTHHSLTALAIPDRT